MSDLVRTLVVDDEESIRFFLKGTLQRSGHIVTTASSGEEALDRLRETPFDLIVLDLMLGGQVDGQRVLEAVRWRWPAAVVIMLTAHGSLESAVSAIEEGVDGYLLKPVTAAQVRRSVQDAFERRRKLTQLQGAYSGTQLLQRGPFSVDLERRQAALEGQTLNLTPSDFKLLVYLLQNAGRTISPVELVRVVRDYEPEYLHQAQQIIKWYIHRLRQKVEPDPSSPRHIVNVRGEGYVLEA